MGHQKNIILIEKDHNFISLNAGFGGVVGGIS
jgi:hypothetical protein